MTDNTRTVRIVVLGDAGVGKTSLVMSLLLEKFPKDEESLAVLPEVAIPSKYNPDNVNVFIVDTPADIESLGERPIHAIILVYDVQSPESFHRLKSHWLPWLVKKGHNVPVILAGNKIDLRGADMDNPKLVDQTVPLMAEFRCIETCIECSAKQMINVSEVFYFAQKSVIHPSAPLYDAEENVVRDECLAAMQRIFRHCDLDGDGFLSDMELDYFQRRCFNKPLQKTDIAGIKETITEAFPEGVTPQGITEAGFMHMNKMFIQRGRLDTFWGILRAFGYNDELKMELPQIGLDGDSTLEITSYGTKLLSDLFKRFSLDQEFISPGQLNDLFRLTVDGRNPWLPHFPKSAVHSENGDLPLDSFLAQWMLFAYELPFEATAVFTELIGLGEVPKSFKVVPFEEINQRRVFKIALLSTEGDGEALMKRLVNPNTENIGAISVDVYYLILSLNDPEPDLCDIVISSTPYDDQPLLSPITIIDYDKLETTKLLEIIKKTQQKKSGKWKGALVAGIAALTFGTILYYRYYKRQL